MTKRLHFLAGLLLVLCFLCTACGGTGETIPSQDDPNEGLGGGFNEDAVNDFSSYEGIWLGEANNEYDYIEFDADGSWHLYLTGDVVDEGYLRYEPEWGAVYAYSSLDDSGNRMEIQNGQLYITSFGYFNYGDGMEYYTGLWEYGNENLWLRVNDDATWEFINDQDEVIEYGTLWIDDAGITLHFDGSGDTLQLDRTVSGDLIDSVNDTVLFPVEGIESAVPYFTRNGLEINAAVDTGTFLLENGVCSYSGLGDGYNTDDCYWEIIKNGDYTHDGIRELHFDAVCYIPENSIPYFSEQYFTVTGSELYDFYTGMWLTAATSYGNSQRGDNYYLHTVSWRGNSYLIEFAYSTDWKYNVGDWAQVLTKSYAVYLPEEYDGLVFAAEAQPMSYKDTAKRMQLDSISPEVALMDIDTVDPYSSLYFSLCY